MTIHDGMTMLDPALYAQGGPPHDLFTELRRSEPVARFEIPGIEPFWAIVKHSDITWISKRPGQFLSGPGITLAPVDQSATDVPGFSTMRVVINMDPPEHRKVRKVASPWFTPRALQQIDDEVEKSATELVDALVERERLPRRHGHRHRGQASTPDSLGVAGSPEGPGVEDSRTVQPALRGG